MSRYDEIKSIVLGKLVDKTIDLDYSELSELVFGEGVKYNSSEVRKRMYGMLHLIQSIEEGSSPISTAQELINGLDDRRAEIYIESQRLKDQRRELNRLLRDESRYRHLEESIISAANSMNKVRPLSCKPVERPSDDGANEGIIVFNDWHYGMSTKNIWNEFNTDICRQRVEKFIDIAVDKILLHNLKTVHIVILGDMAHGAIHTSARVASEELVCDQLMNVSEMLANAISHISNYTNKVLVYSTFGNHMRTVQNKNDSIHADNMERIIPWWLSSRLSHIENINIVQTDDYHEFLKINVCGRNVCAVHGDLDTVKNFGVTSNAIFNRKFKETIDYTIVADKHHIEEFESLGVENILVRSLCGTDEYANQKRLYSAAGQTMIVFNEDYGKDAVYHIKLD